MAGLAPDPGPPAVLDMVLEADLLGEDGPAPAEALFHLSKEAFKHHVTDGLWRVRAATSATSLGTVITSDPVIGQIRKEPGAGPATTWIRRNLAT